MKLLLRGAPKIKLTIDLQNELDSLTGTYVPIPLPSVSLTNIAVTGQFDLIKGGLATVVVSGSIGKNRVHAVFQKPLKAGKFSGAFAADFGPIRLSNIISKDNRSRHFKSTILWLSHYSKTWCDCILRLYHQLPTTKCLL